MRNFEKFNSRGEEKKSTNTGPSESHSARWSSLRSLGITEECFLQGLESSKDSEDLGSSRKTGEFGLDHPSSSREGDRPKAREEQWQELEKIETSLFEVSKELHKARKIIMNYEEQPPRALGALLERYGEIKKCQEGLAKVIETHEISDGNFQQFFALKEQLIEYIKRSITKELNSKGRVELDNIEKRVKLFLDLFNKEKKMFGLETLEMFKNGKLKEVISNVQSYALDRVDNLRTENQGMFQWIDGRKEDMFLEIKQSDVYIGYKACGSKFDNISKQLKELGKDGSRTSESFQEIIHQEDPLGELAATYGRFYKIDKELREKLYKIVDPLIEQRRNIFELAEDQSAKRRARGVDEQVIEANWELFYQPHMCKLTVIGSWLNKLVETGAIEKNQIGKIEDKLRRFGKVIKTEPQVLKGKEDDYYFVMVVPKLPDNSQSFDGFRLPLMAFVNPKEGVMVVYTENRRVDQEWREKTFPKEFPQEWLDRVKNKSNIKEASEALKIALYSSDLTALSYQSVVKEYTKNGEARVPLSEFMIAGIINPETKILLDEYMKSEMPVIFRPGEEGFDRVSATNFGRRVPFMMADHRDKIGDGVIDHYEIHILPNGVLPSIKCVIKPKDESGA